MVVADEELLVKHRRVEIGDHIDAGPKQRRVDAAVGLVVPPLVHGSSNGFGSTR
jgi:hypothetical protein